MAPPCTAHQVRVPLKEEKKVLKKKEKRKINDESVRMLWKKKRKQSRTSPWACPVFFFLRMASPVKRIDKKFVEKRKTEKDESVMML
jgi:hypothetical protein